MTLEKCANITVCLTGLFIIANIAADLGTQVPKPSETYKPGVIIKNTAALDLKSAPQTVLLITASGCHFCTASTSFYRTLVTAAREHGTKVIGVTAEDPHINQSYLASHGVALDTVVSSAANGISVHGTPTLILVRSDGRVIQSWHGQLASEEEQEVLKTIKSKQGV